MRLHESILESFLKIPGQKSSNLFARPVNLNFHKIKHPNSDIIYFDFQNQLRLIFFFSLQTGSGILLQQELKSFFISIVGLRNMTDDDMTELYKSMTSVSNIEIIFFTSTD